MKNVVMSLVFVGLWSALSAAGLDTQDAAFLFGQNSVDAVVMSGAEMARTEGQVLDILALATDLLTPVLGLVSTLLDALDPIYIHIQLGSLFEITL